MVGEAGFKKKTTNKPSKIVTVRVFVIGLVYCSVERVSLNV